MSNNIVDVFKQADQRCGFTKVLQQATYPPRGKIAVAGDPEGENFRLKRRQGDPDCGCIANPNTPALVNQSINACNLAPGTKSACATFTTGMNYLVNKLPWYMESFLPQHMMALAVLDFLAVPFDQFFLSKIADIWFCSID